MRHNIVLVGFMGTGKSVVGKRVAEKLGRRFLELDEIIEKKEGASIKEIFEKKGELYFRRIEKETVKEVSQKIGVVISVGGGAIIDEENFNNLKRNSVIICLEASPDTILERTKGLRTRPLLNVPDPKQKIEGLLKKRASYYKRADYCIDTNRLMTGQVVTRVIELVSQISS